jgi:hypothetical protein
VESGLLLSQAMARHPKVFSRLYVAMVEAGEAAGILDEVLDRVAFQIEKETQIKRRVKGAMIYPTMVLIFATLVLIGMLMFLVPVFVKIFEDLGGQLPTLTQWVVNVSEFLRGNWYLVFPSLFAFGFALPAALVRPAAAPLFVELPREDAAGSEKERPAQQHSVAHGDLLCPATGATALPAGGARRSAGGVVALTAASRSRTRIAHTTNMTAAESGSIVAMKAGRAPRAPSRRRRMRATAERSGAGSPRRSDLASRRSASSASTPCLVRATPSGVGCVSSRKRSSATRWGCSHSVTVAVTVSVPVSASFSASVMPASVEPRQPRRPARSRSAARALRSEPARA